MLETDSKSEMAAKVTFGKKAKKLDKKGLPKAAGNGTTFNMDSLEDEDGDSPDWIELFNSGSTPVDLDGWYLSDDPALLTKWHGRPGEGRGRPAPAPRATARS